MILSHYYEKGRIPFLTLSDLSDGEAVKIHARYESGKNNFAMRNHDGNYISHRRMVESKLYSKFVEKGGKPKRRTPHYMILGEYVGSKRWFNDTCKITIPLDSFNKCMVSFTYGDSFPTFIAPSFGRTDWHLDNIYTYDEILDIIKEHGMPQGQTAKEPVDHAHPNYIEAQIWYDEIINQYR